MTSIVSALNQPNDRFGYSCYALVLMASPSIAAQVDRIRQEAGMTRAAIPAHVTVKGTFLGIHSLEQVQEIVAQISGETKPFFVSFDTAESAWWDGGGALRLTPSPETQALHDQLVAAITPLGTQAYKDDPYRPHMTYLQDVEAAGMARAQEMLRAINFGAGFMADGVVLWGRVGPAYGGEWQRIRRFPFSSSSEGLEA